MGVQDSGSKGEIKRNINYGERSGFKNSFVLIVLSSIVLGLIIIVFISFPFLNFMVSLVYKPVKENPFNILILGLDKVIEGTVRTDAILLVIIDHLEGKIVLSNIPRDLMINGFKINSVYERKGIKELEKVIENLTGLKINRFVLVNYDVFRILGDELGPIEVTVNEPMYYHDYVQNLTIDFKPGVTYKMKGEELLAYIRYRKNALGDIGRLERQKDVLKKMFEKAKKLDIFKLGRLYSKLKKLMETDLDLSELIYLFSKVSKKGQISFIGFPYTITSKGEVITDNKRLENYRKALKDLSISEARKNYKIVVLNNSKLKNRVFETRVRSWWRKILGWEPEKVVWEDVEIDLEGSHVFILSKSMVDKEAILEVLKKVYPKETFKVHMVSWMESIDEYYKIMEKLSEKRIYINRPVNALIILGVPGGG